MTARTSDGTSSGYFQRSAIDINALDTERIANESIRKTVEGRNARTIEPGVYNVILEPQAVADLLGGIAFQFNARLAEEGRSPFSVTGGKTKLGQKIFDERINILSDPWNALIPDSPFAQDGIPAGKIYFVKNGVLENLIYNRFWAKQKNTEPTPGPVNTILESSEKPASIDEMIKATKKGLLVSRFWYIRTTDPRTASSTRLDARRRVDDRKRQSSLSGEKFPFQSINHPNARARKRRNDRHARTHRRRKFFTDSGFEDQRI